MASKRQRFDDGRQKNGLVKDNVFPKDQHLLCRHKRLRSPDREKERKKESKRRLSSWQGGGKFQTNGKCRSRKEKHKFRGWPSASATLGPRNGATRRNELRFAWRQSYRGRSRGRRWHCHWTRGSVFKRSRSKLNQLKQLVAEQDWLKNWRTSPKIFNQFLKCIDEKYNETKLSNN